MICLFWEAKITSLFPGAIKANTIKIPKQETRTIAVDDLDRVIGSEEIESVSLWESLIIPENSQLYSGQ